MALDKLREALNKSIDERRSISTQLEELLHRINVLTELIEQARLDEAVSEHNKLVDKISALNVSVGRLTALLEQANAETLTAENALKDEKKKNDTPCP